MADAPEIVFALFLEHGIDCPACRTSDRPCDTGQELLRIHNADRPEVADAHSGASGRCDCCGRDQELSAARDPSPTGPGRTRYVCQGCAPRPVARDRISEGVANGQRSAVRRERQRAE